MQKTKIQQIKDLLIYLPEKDISLAEEFLEGREIESLYEVVKSDLEKYVMDLEKPIEERKYNNINAIKFGELWVLVSEYWDGIRPIEEEEYE